jgi:hypothetical protein
MRKRDIVLGLTVTLALAAILIPLATVFLISAAVLVIPAAPVVAVAVVAALLMLPVRSKQAWAAGPPQVDARPHQCSLPRVRARIRSQRA